MVIRAVSATVTEYSSLACNLIEDEYETFTATSWLSLCGRNGKQSHAVGTICSLAKRLSRRSLLLVHLSIVKTMDLAIK
ncbi:hypothetical protein RJT34_04277 [Clitoria ternatea]|uniref:Uncharacterized protein n=1 Tax=Clitoria ternatea TaxID=43366 RepID=A0AAN9KKM6_CLITE